MKRQRTVLGLQGLVSGYTLLHHEEQEPDATESTPSKNTSKPTPDTTKKPTK